MARSGILSAIIFGLSLTGAAQAEGATAERTAAQATRRNSEALLQFEHGAEAVAGSDLSSAIEAFKTASLLNPQSAGTAFTLASALALDGDMKAAAGHLKRAIDLDPVYIRRALESPEFAGIKLRTAPAQKATAPGPL